MEVEVPELVRAAQRGEPIAMARLLDLLAPYVARLCGPIALADADDAAQEALLAVFRGLRALREPEALYGWVRVTAVREALRVARRRDREHPVEALDPPHPADAQTRVDIRDVLDRMSPEHRTILMLREVEGLDERDAARLLGISVGTVKSRLHRARARFREAWAG